MLILAVVFTINSCKQAPKKVVSKKDSLAKEWGKTIQGNFSTQSQTVFDSTKITAFISRYPDFKNYEPDLRNFYLKRKFAYAWFEKDTLIEQAGNLSNRIINLQNEGVYKPAPYQKQLDSLLNTLTTGKKQVDVNLELMLTAEYFVFSKLA
ncbi:MAG: murein L,D-transpeptidase, partial [Sphingobacteriaceae bacterium]